MINEEVLVFLGTRVRQLLAGRLPRHILATLAAAVALGTVAMDAVPAADHATQQASQQSQKPVRQHRFHTDGGAGAPATLEALWEMSDSVFDCVAVAERPADVGVTLDDGRQDVIVKTHHEFEVLSVLKSPRAVVGSRITVEMMGGLRDRGNYVDDYIDDAFPRFKKGQHFLLFLRYVSSRDIYLPVTGTADSAFLEHNTRIAPLGRSKLARSLAGQSLEELVARLRRKRGGNHAN